MCPLAVVLQESDNLALSVTGVLQGLLHESDSPALSVIGVRHYVIVVLHESESRTSSFTGVSHSCMLHDPNSSAVYQMQRMDVVYKSRQIFSQTDWFMQTNV